jgi:amino acid transporter
MNHAIFFVLGISLILAIPFVHLIIKRISYRHDVLLAISGTGLIIIFYACVIISISVIRNQIDRQYIILLIITNAICVLPIICAIFFPLFYFYKDWLIFMEKNLGIKLGK